MQASNSLRSFFYFFNNTWEWTYDNYLRYCKEFQLPVVSGYARFNRISDARRKRKNKIHQCHALTQEDEEKIKSWFLDPSIKPIVPNIRSNE